MTDTTPWHEGERAVQRRLGFAEHAEARGVNIRDFMPEQHRAFFAQLPFAVLGALDPVGNPWATVLTGEPGFLSSPNPNFLHIGAYPQDGDPAASGILPGARIGLLGIELSTRRRNRMNGRVIDIDISGFTVMVEQSFGNCPQYIQRRDYGRRRRPSFPEAESLAFGDAWAMGLIAGADTAFVASSTPPGTDQSGGGVDVSHRGGRPGFIRAAEDGAFEIPDYRGNRFFNTLGNLLAYPRAGLVIVDFASGDVLQMTGTAEIVWDGSPGAAPAAERLWRLKPVRMLRLRGAFPFEFGSPEFSPLLAATAS